MQLDWRKCAHDAWCPFETVVLPDANASGILLVWPASGERVVFIAQGGIAKNLKWARQFEPIAAQRNLFVSWATIPEAHQDGVRNYLLGRAPPVHGDPPSPDDPIPVNLPWEAG
ncbi:MAG: hypothetical protein ABI186_00545 [Candidatus Elarobacter sp.]